MKEGRSTVAAAVRPVLCGGRGREKDRGVGVSKHMLWWGYVRAGKSKRNMHVVRKKLFFSVNIFEHAICIYPSSYHPSTLTRESKNNFSNINVLELAISVALPWILTRESKNRFCCFFYIQICSVSILVLFRLVSTKN